MTITLVFMIINAALLAVAVAMLVVLNKKFDSRIDSLQTTETPEEAEITKGEAEFLASLSEMMMFTGELPQKGVRNGD